MPSRRPSLGGLLILPVGLLSDLHGIAAAVHHPGVVPTEALPRVVLDLPVLASRMVLAGPTRTFTVRNDGTATLTVGAVMVPAGYALIDEPTTSLAPGASDTFTVQLEATTVGTRSGEVSFATNDNDEDPFNFPVTGTVAGLLRRRLY